MSFRKYIDFLSYLVLFITVVLIGINDSIIFFILSFCLYQITWRIIERNKLWFLVPFQFSVLIFFLLRPITYSLYGGASYSRNFNLDIDKLMHAFWLLLAMQVLVVVVFTMLKIKKLDLGDSAPKIKVLKIWFLFVLIKLATGLTSIVLFQVLDGYLSVMMMLIALSPYLFESSTKIKLIVYVTSVLLEVHLGNKGGLYTVAMMVLFEIYIRNLKVSIYKMTLSVGIISFFGLITFFIGADIRHGISLLEGLENIPTIFEHSDYYLSALFERVGYLDVLARFVFDHRDYSDIFNLKYYFISIVDNLPVGVNLNNNLRVSTAIHFIGQPNSTNYFSEIITLPAEMLMVFGGVFLAPLMLILLISRVVLMLSPIYMMISLGLVFDRFLFLSFGLDWMLELLFLFLFFAFLLRLRLC